MQEKPAIELIAIMPAPEGLQKAYVNVQTGLTGTIPATYIGWANNLHFTEGTFKRLEQKPRPMLDLWATTGSDGFWWERVGSGNEHHNRANGRCACERPACGELPINEWATMPERLEQVASERLEALKKLEVQRAKAKQYAKQRKEKKDAGKVAV